MPLFRIAIAAVLIVISASVAWAASPNVIVIMADDLGYGDLGCYGHPKFKTPHLDRMAAEGARLTQFNTPIPFCAPTRAALLTGRYPFRCGMPSNPAPDGGPIANLTHLPETEITLGQCFQQAGYATTIIGKWHLGHAKPEWLPTQRGFDSYFGIPYSNDMRPVKLFEGTKSTAEFPLDQTKLTQRYTDRAIAFIEQNRSRPFFLYLPHAMPHKPLAASEQFHKQTGHGLYGDVIAELDASVGRLFAKLKESRLDDNTFVLFTSDNGPWYGGSTAGLRGMKGSTYEGGHRVPCIARWPGKIPAGHVSRELAVTMDVFATVLHVAGITAPQDRVIDGRNLMPILTSADAKSPHPAILGAQGGPVTSIRDGRWKLHVLPAKDPFLGATKRGGQWTDPRGPDGKTILAPLEQPQPNDYPGVQTGVASAAMQLFDLASDPAEQIDVAQNHPEV
ncbi:MAG: Arylsulfatase, partial [Planctomycetota bacterium]